MTKPTVVFHIDAFGNVQNYADGAVDVIWVSDMTPNDRLYKTSPDPIPDGMLDGGVGGQFDGSQAMVKLQRTIKSAVGESHLTVAGKDESK